MDNPYDGISGSYVESRANGVFIKNSFYWVKDIAGDFENEWGNKMRTDMFFDVEYAFRHPFYAPTGLMRPLPHD